MDTFKKIKYSELNKLQVGQLGEYWTKILLTMNGLDIYTTEVDNKGIDFIVRLNDEKFIDIQVKTIRNSGYVYIPCHTWHEPDEILRENLYLALTLLNDNEIPISYLIPSKVWKNPEAPFSYKDSLVLRYKSKIVSWLRISELVV